jgi:hypothetical protein
MCDMRRFPSQNIPVGQKELIIKDRYALQTASELQVGDCTAHHGWTKHSAGKQPEKNGARFVHLRITWTYSILIANEYVDYQ